jgi:hypothetical protein
VGKNNLLNEVLSKSLSVPIFSSFLSIGCSNAPLIFYISSSCLFACNSLGVDRRPADGRGVRL